MMSQGVIVVARMSFFQLQKNLNCLYLNGATNHLQLSGATGQACFPSFAAILGGVSVGRMFLFVP